VRTIHAPMVARREFDVTALIHGLIHDLLTTWPNAAWNSHAVRATQQSIEARKLRRFYLRATRMSDACDVEQINMVAAVQAA
jgi:hypothetical protein